MITRIVTIGFCVLSMWSCASDIRREQSSTTVPGTSHVEQIPSPSSERWNRTPYEAIFAGSHSDSQLVSLCTLVRHPQFGGGGLYRVDALTGYTERLRDKRDEAITYVEFTLVEDWFKSGKRLVARIPGGPAGPDSELLWEFNLKVGDIVGVLFRKHRADNAGYADLDPLGVFTRRENGGYSNGQLFTKQSVTASRLGDLVKGLTGGTLRDSCPYDEWPDLLANSEQPTVALPN